MSTNMAAFMKIMKRTNWVAVSTTQWVIHACAYVQCIHLHSGVLNHICPNHHTHALHQHSDYGLWIYIFDGKILGPFCTTASKDKATIKGNLRLLPYVS